MDLSISSLPGYQVNKYKIIITPNEDLAERIMIIQKDFIAKYKVEYKSVYRPQMILCSFSQFQVHEARIINRLRIMAMGFTPLRIELKDFGSYPSHTIFINVATQNTITGLVKKIREQSQRLMKLDPENKPHFLSDAHLTIARKLKPWQYEQGWLEYSHRHFTGKFIAGRMILMRKKPGDTKFTPIESFEFQNLPVETKQGNLF